MVKTGVVKWFNNKKGFGFITEIVNDDYGEDIFVHHSGITRKTEGYRFLVDGEYVTFEEKPVDDESSKYKKTCVNVRGIGGLDLMCEKPYKKKQ